MNLITASIVTFHNKFDDLKKVIKSFLDTELNVKLYIVDNSNNKDIETLCTDKRIDYIYNGKNLGFGKAHNIAIKKSIISNSQYHLILNPDVYYDKGVIENIVNFMNKKESEDVGLVMPKVLYPDGNIQRLCKLLPTPIDLISRKLVIFKKLLQKTDYKYEMHFSDYNSQMEVPYLSGCFMFVRTKVFDTVGLFDENYFMYMEDIDLSRRINSHFRNIYFPEVLIYHRFEKGSYYNRNLLFYHLKSALYYFNKWGWFFDKERNKVNKDILSIHLK